MYRRPYLIEDEDELARPDAFKRAYDRTYWFWIALITFDLVVQCFRSAEMDEEREKFISTVSLLSPLGLITDFCFRQYRDCRDTDPSA